MVEAVFTRSAELWELRIGNQIIETTSEHPFFSSEQKWVPARELRPGETISTIDGEWLPIEAITNTHRVETVYNLSVQDYRTYFVGRVDWGFSVWAHNTCTGLPSANATNSQLPLKGFHGSQGPNPFHALDRAIERGVSPQAILQTLRNPSVVVNQSGGRTLYLTTEAAVVLNAEGQAVTMWSGAQHNQATLALLRAAGVIP